VFVTLLNTTCSTQVATRVISETPNVAIGDGRRDAVVDGGGGGGNGNGAEGCTPLETLPDGCWCFWREPGNYGHV
jgi:hypothetical protein